MPLPISLFWLNHKPRLIASILILLFCITGVGLIYSLDITPDLFQGRSILDTLPVVVHVIHTGTPIGSPDNPSDANINAMITLMNNAFQKNGAMYGGANIGLAFKLATKSPGCGSTTGINRINGSSVTHYVTGGITTDTVYYPNSAHELHVKALSRWPNTDYINIWVVNMIDGDPNGLEGYAYFPELNSALIDGVVIKASAVNGTNKNIIHELGHYFYLYHSFGDNWASCATETNCATQGDLICDTEKCMFTYDCTATTNPCTGLPWLIADAGLNYTVLNNYMGYTNCQWMFTEGQKTRMLDALNTFRPGILSSLALQGTAGSVPVAACVPTAVNGLSPYYGIERVQFGSLNVYSNTSLADAQFYIDRTCNQQLTVNVGQTVSISITPSYQNWSQVKVFLDYNGNGVFEPPGELILSGSDTIVSGNVTIPSTSIQLCTPLRLRVVADHPSAPPPSACLLTGTPAEGVGQIEDYTVIIKPRAVQSLASGNWNNPAVWSCNCVPSATDALLIKSGHIITVPLALGTVNCASIKLQPTGQLIAIANVHVAGGCQ
jgi:hypothetical protein